MADINRIKNEMNKLKNSQDISVKKTERIDNNDLIWKVVFEGPKETAYEDGIFTLKFVFPNNYPTGGPEALFITKMFHPNVSEGDQHVCINLLNSWDPNRTIEDVLLGIFCIMMYPITAEAYSNEASSLLRQDNDKYYDKVKEYTYKYAQNEC